jgi:hypothetical protein
MLFNPFEILAPFHTSRSHGIHFIEVDFENSKEKASGSKYGLHPRCEEFLFGLYQQNTETRIYFVCYTAIYEIYYSFPIRGVSASLLIPGAHCSGKKSGR